MTLMKGFKLKLLTPAVSLQVFSSTVMKYNENVKMYEQLITAKLNIATGILQRYYWI